MFKHKANKIFNIASTPIYSVSYNITMTGIPMGLLHVMWFVR